MANVNEFTDNDAIHDNVAGEISAVTEKSTPVSADMIIIEDSAAANVKKMVQMGNLTATDSDAIHDNVAAEIAALSPITLADGDSFVVEDLNAGTANSKLKCLASAIWTYILAKLAAAGITLGGTLNMADNDITNIKTATFTPVVITTPGATETIDWSAGIKQKITLDASCTFTFTDPAEWVNHILVIVQGGTGSYAVTWPANVKWDTAGTAPTLSTAVGSIDVVAFLYNSTDDEYYGQTGLDFQ